MTTVDRIKAILKEKNIPVSKLERDLGYSNGYIGQLKKGTLRDDRLSAIAKYLGVSIQYLTGNQEPVDDDVEDLKKRRNDALIFALYDGADVEITDDMYDEIKRFAQFAAQQKKEKT